MTTIRSEKFLSVVVYRANGNYIQSIEVFTDFGEAVDYASRTPVPLTWYMQFNLKYDHDYDNRVTDGTTDTFSTGQRDYVGCYYD